MKHNIIFALLTAVILVSGFFTMDIVQYFNKSTSEESFQSISKGESNAVYLSSEREVINPTSIITPSEQEISPIYRDVATNIVRAMSRYNNTTYIAWGTDINLYDAWQYGGDNLIYVDKWKYINYGKKSERLLDCIINTEDFNILYIRFYSEEKHELSTNEINRGLDIISSESAEFYPYVNDIAQNIEDTLKYLRDVHEQEYDGVYNSEYIHFYDIGQERTAYSDYNYYYNNNNYISSYNNMKEFVNYYFSDSELYKFWLSPLDISCIDIIYNDGMYENTIIAYPVHYLLDEFMQLSLWFHPSYSSKDGRIYQSMILNTGKLVVIYSVKEDMIEGFYFESD